MSYSDTVNENSHKDYLKDKLCDKCKTDPAMKWFGSTSMMLCESHKCYSLAQDEYNAHVSSEEKEYE